MFGIPLSELLLLAAALLIAGAVTGVLAGLFGVGGGGVIVPVLYQLFIILDVPPSVRMPLAVGTSFAVMVPTSLRSALAHHARGAVDIAVVKVWALPCFLGVVVGSVIAAFAPPQVFMSAFILIGGINAFKLLAGRDTWRLGNDLPGPVAMRIAGFVIACTSTLMGVAGGALSNLTMSLYNRPIHQAVATSAAVGVFIVVPATIGYVLAGLSQNAILPPLSLGFVSAIGFLMIAPTSLLLAPVGARIAHRFSRRQLEVAFGLFLSAVALRFAVGLFW